MSAEAEDGVELIRRFGKKWPIVAAFWLKESDDPHTYLYLALDGIDGVTTSAAYLDMHRLFRNLDSSIDPFRVKLIGSTDPLAEAALKVTARRQRQGMTRLGGCLFGGLSVDGVTIYPKAAGLAPGAT